MSQWIKKLQINVAIESTSRKFLLETDGDPKVEAIYRFCACNVEMIFRFLEFWYFPAMLGFCLARRRIVTFLMRLWSKLHIAMSNPSFALTTQHHLSSVVIRFLIPRHNCLKNKPTSVEYHIKEAPRRKEDHRDIQNCELSHWFEPRDRCTTE